MNKKSKVLQERNHLIQARFVEELAKTGQSAKNQKITVLSIYQMLAEGFDLSAERVREIACGRRI